MVNERSGRVRRGAVLIPFFTLFIIVALAFGSYRAGLLNDAICDGPCAAAYVEPPVEIVGPIDPVRIGVSLGDLSPASSARVAAAVRSALEQPALGAHVGFAAIDMGSGELLAGAASDVFIPASTTKVLTAFAALASMDADTRFATRVLRTSASGLVLVGGGDPYLGIVAPEPARYAHRATLADLAKRTAAALAQDRITSVTLDFDDSLFSGPSASSHWESTYVSGNIVTPVSALWADQGVVAGIRSRTPARSAAASFAAQLEKLGVVVEVGTRAQAANEATEVARVESATVRQILEYVVKQSDNEGAEVMLRHVALAAGKPGTFEAGTELVEDLLREAGIDTSGLLLYDGSGLSRDNRISPLTLAQTIRTASLDPRTAGLLSELPIAGFNGSTADRFQGESSKTARGLVRAKTGTLTGVHSLAGTVRDAQGRAIAFAVMADATRSKSPVATESALDEVVAAIATCRCGA